VYQQFSSCLQPDKLLVVSAKVSKREGEEVKLLANSLILLDEKSLPDTAVMLRDNLWVPGDQTNKNYVQLSDQKKNTPLPKLEVLEIVLIGKPSSEIITSLRELFVATPGQRKVRFVIDMGGTKRIVETDYSINSTAEFLAEAKSIVGAQNVRMV
jgi:hypothetical protein